MRHTRYPSQHGPTPGITVNMPISPSNRVDSHGHKSSYYEDSARLDRLRQQEFFGLAPPQPVPVLATLGIVRSKGGNGDRVEERAIGNGITAKYNFRRQWTVSSHARKSERKDRLDLVWPCHLTIIIKNGSYISQTCDI